MKPSWEDLPPPFYDSLEEYAMPTEISEEQIKKIEETHSAVITIRTVLLGANGDEGLVGDVHKLACLQTKTESRLNKLYIIVAGIGGVGLIGGGLTKLLELW